MYHGGQYHELVTCIRKQNCPPAELDGRLRALDRPLVFTNGVFDVLHRGHVTYLAESRALGASLILALNSDSSVKRLGKGPDRPVNPWRTGLR